MVFPPPCKPTMSMLSMMLTFPHAELMPIIGTPHNTSLKLLTKEIYANACAIPSTCGGSGHGHLGLIMPVAEYVIVAGIAFQLPMHPGPVPTHAAGANAATHQENIHLFNATITELSIAMTVQEEIKKQLLITVNHLYLAALDDDTFGFADVTVAAMRPTVPALPPFGHQMIPSKHCGSAFGKSNASLSLVAMP